ncbi:hypothetical protein D1872_228640 [compost metagenome]
MGLHDGELFRRQFAGFVEDGVGNGDLSDIMHRRGDAQHLRLIGRESVAEREDMGIFRDSSDMVPGFPAAHFTDLAHGEDNFFLRLFDFV